ncbi:hypothetical protein ACLOJK_029580, partial [Asimina triloba]
MSIIYQFVVRRRKIIVSSTIRMPIPPSIVTHLQPAVADASPSELKKTSTNEETHPRRHRRRIHRRSSSNPEVVVASNDACLLRRPSSSLRPISPGIAHRFSVQHKPDGNPSARTRRPSVPYVCEPPPTLSSPDLPSSVGLPRSVRPRPLLARSSFCPSTVDPASCHRCLAPALVCQRQAAAGSTFVEPGTHRPNPLVLRPDLPRQRRPTTGSRPFILSCRCPPTPSALAAVRWSLLGEEGGAPYYGAPAAHQTSVYFKLIRYSSGARNYDTPSGSFGTPAMYIIFCAHSAGLQCSSSLFFLGCSFISYISAPSSVVDPT